MIPLISKPTTAITPADVDRLVAESYPEEDGVDYKQAPSTRDGFPDRWITSGENIGNTAQNELLEAITAFANTYGGHLIFGIAETKERPTRASRQSPIPRGIELPERRQLQIQD